jgi:hypothetical protein
MNSNSAKTFTRGKWAVLFLALLIVPEFAFAQTIPKKTTPAPAPKQAPAKPAPANPPQQKPTAGPDPNSVQKPNPPVAVKPNPPVAVKPNPPVAVKPNRPVVGKTVLPGGGSRETRADGSTVERDKSGRVKSVTSRTGATAKFDGRGDVSSVNFKSSKGFDTKVSRGANGSRTVVSEHVNDRGERITTVNTGPNRGYVDHTFTRNGQPYMRRTYVAGDHSYAVVYRGYYYGGRPYFAYVPGYYYAPGFYGWAYAPFGAPVAFAWGWGAAPWYGYSAYYFTPYAVYPGPAPWLTDYVVSENLQSGYETSGEGPRPSDDQQEGVPPSSGNGLVYVPVLSAGTKNLAQGFSEAGGVSFADDRIYLSAGGTASYSFSVPAGRTETIAYGIPTGGYTNSAPAEVSINGVTDTIIKTVAGGSTQTQLLLWRKSFGPGRYVLTFRSGGFAVNFYGLWIESAPSDVQASASGGDPNKNSAGITPEAKAAISEEVKLDLQSEQVASTSVPPASDVPAALDPKQRTFIVSSALSEHSTDGASCSLSAGDIVTRVTDTPDTNQKVTALVTGSQKNDCASGSMLSISLQELQDMHNDFAQKLDAGLQKLADNEGKNGIPAGPAAGRRANPDGQAQPDMTASSDLQQQQKDADSAEKEVNQAVAPGQGN